MTNQPITKSQINLGVKICDCFFSGAGLMLMLYFLKGFIPPNAVPVLGIIIAAAAILFLLAWNYHANNEDFPYAKVHAWLTGIIRYSMAYVVATYGFAKVLKTQFGTFYARNDIPVGNLSGFDLTWQYFGYSYKLALILATLQIGGAVLLFFRRTTLLSIFILLPVMLNIVLINIFYNIAFGAFIVSTVITAALTYLLVLNREPLIRVFFYTVNSLPQIKLSYFKNVIRLSLMVISFFTVYRYLMYKKPVDFLGKWKVEKMERNGQPIPGNAWMTDSTAWKNIYIEEHGILFLSPNPYIFELTRSKRVTFKYDEKAKKLNLTLYKEAKPVDSTKINITKKTEEYMEWTGRSKNSTFKILLKKQKEVVH